MSKVISIHTNISHSEVNNYINKILKAYKKPKVKEDRNMEGHLLCPSLFLYDLETDNIKYINTNIFDPSNRCLYPIHNVPKRLYLKKKINKDDILDDTIFNILNNHNDIIKIKDNKYDKQYYRCVTLYPKYLSVYEYGIRLFIQSEMILPVSYMYGRDETFYGQYYVLIKGLVYDKQITMDLRLCVPNSKSMTCIFNMD